jgi:hypothetical protein
MRVRRRLAVAGALLAGVALAAFAAHADPLGLALNRGEDVSVTCPTELSLEFVDASTAVARCAPSTDDAAPATDDPGQ